MAEDQPMVASAVIVPEAQEDQDQESPPGGSVKRRQSSVLETESKRPRLSIDASDEATNGHEESTPTDNDRQRPRRRIGQQEERKRGQRLFGALLGTLSQGSSSTAQKRRADIEKKQQAKLKLQEEQDDEKKRQDLDKLKLRRKREQKRFDEQTMRIRHSNMLATANYLQTSAEPNLYYKPWELLPEEVDRIKSQVAEADSTVDREAQEFNTARRREQETSRSHGPAHDQPNDAELAEPAELTGHESQQVNTVTDDEQATSPSKGDDATNGEVAPMPDVLQERETHEAAKDSHDDGDGEGGDVGEVMLEGEEDTVIY